MQRCKFSWNNMFFVTIVCCAAFVGGRLGAFAKGVSLGGGATAVVEGTAQELENNRWILSKGATLKIEGVPELVEQTLTAYGAHVTVKCASEGIAYASGIFGIRTNFKDGTVVRIPGSLTQLKMKRHAEEEDALEFTTESPDLEESVRCVAWKDGLFRVRGTTSVEALHPKTDESPARLVSLAGETDRVVASSDLETGAVFEESKANLWENAYADLKIKRDFLRSIQVDENRVGAAAYKSMIRETLQGLDKLREGYDLLRTGRYTQEVLKRMLQKGVGIPRLNLISCRVVSGDAAFSLNAFENWQGKGRVIANIAFLTNENQEAPEQPPFAFELRDGSGLVGEDTRVRIEEGDGVVEVRGRRDEDWTERNRIQFDLLAEVNFASDDDTASLQVDLDVTGFLLRKAYQVVGEVSLGKITATRDSLTIEYKPTAPSKTVATRFSRFLAIRKILTFPRRDVILDDYRPEIVDDQTWENFGLALDHMADAVHRARIDQIDEFQLVLSRVEGKTWKLVGHAVGDDGRSADAEYQAKLDSDPLKELWKRIDANREAVYWLDLDLGLGFAGM